MEPGTRSACENRKGRRMSRIKISVITPDGANSIATYRSIGPFMKLPDSEFDIRIFDGRKGYNLWEAILFGDIVFTHAIFDEKSVRICDTVKKAGKRLWIDWDDDLSCVPAWNRNHAAFANCERNLIAIAKMADVVTVTSSALVAQAKKWGGKNVIYLPNAIDDDFRCLPTHDRTDVIVWRGGDSHIADTIAGKETFRVLGADHEIVFIGSCPDLAWSLPRWRHFGITDYANYITLLNSLAPTAMFVPLVDHPFNAAKSDIAAQECWLVGANLIHSGLGEYRDLPVRREPRWLSQTNVIREGIARSLV